MHMPILVAVVAFGKTSTANIVNILVQLGISYRIVLAHELPTCKYTHIILTGGPKYVTRYEYYRLPQWITDSDCPVLGICYGMTLIAHAVGATVQQLSEHEHGPTEVTEIIDGRQLITTRWMNRHYRISDVPKAFHVTGVTTDNHIASFTDYRKWWGCQYHPESVRYRDRNIFARFLHYNAFHKSST